MWNKNSFSWHNSYGNTATIFGAHHPVALKLSQHLVNQGWRIIIPRTTYRKGDSGGAFQNKIEFAGQFGYRQGSG